MRDGRNKLRREALLDCFAILLAAAILILPLWRIEYLKNWGSIDSTFIADARFLKDHWPHPLWMPLWYCGTRWDYIYPPALRYGTAILSMLAGVSTARAYHLYTAIFYAVGIMGVYALVRAGGAARPWGWMGAAAAATLSPSFLFMRSFREDSFLHMPQRLNVLVKWGEGPHMTALALLPPALAFTWWGIRTGSRGWMALAAVSSALVVANNFYGALALAMLFPLLLWSLWITHLDGRMPWRAAAIVALAFGLSAFWLTPSYLRITTENLRLVAQPGNPWSRWVALGLAILFAWASARLARGRKERAWRVFVAGAALFFGLQVIGSYYFDFRLTGEPHRLVPELDLILILLAIEGLRPLAGASARWKQALAAILVLAAFGAGWRYLARPWSVFAADPDYTARVEYRLAEWIARNLPGARTFASGSLRLWYNAWQDEEQVGGGSEQGLLNGEMFLAQWQVTRDTEPGRDIAWLQAVGADAIVLHQTGSEDLLQDFTAPRKFIGRLDVLYDDGRGDVVYRVPRRFPAHARVVEKRRMEAARPIPVSNDDGRELAAYVEAVEHGSDRAVEMRWEGSDAIRLHASLGEGDALLVQQSYDPAWRAYCGGRRVEIHKDAAGFMRVDAPPGEQEVLMVFELPWENVVGRGVSALSALLVLGLAVSKSALGPVLPRTV